MAVSTPASISTGLDVRRLLKWGRRGNMPDADGFNRIYSSVWHIEWNDPCGIAVGPDDVVYVTDRRNSRVQKFTPNGEFIDAWGSSHKGLGGTHKGARDGALRYPHGIAVDSQGFAYVVDAGNCRVQKFRDGQFVLKWGEAGEGDGQFSDPHSVAVGPEGVVYVTDGTCDGVNRVQAFTSEGAFLTGWGDTGHAPGQFRSPGGIAVDAEGYVYVADIDNCRVQKFTSEGAFIRAWGERGGGEGAFQFPNGVAVGPDGHVHVADTFNHRMQVFTAKGDYVGCWGDRAASRSNKVYAEPGDVTRGEFENPRAATVSADGHVYVIDSYTHWAQKFLVRFGGA